jgi:hypothetical protein
LVVDDLRQSHLPLGSTPDMSKSPGDVETHFSGVERFSPLPGPQ